MATMIIGLDGADWQVIDPLLAAGHMPTLKRLIDDGCHGVLRSTIPCNSAPAWASMITGVNPGKHGVFDFVILDDHYRKTPIVLMSKLGAAPLWRMLNEHGISTGIVNLPILYPPEPVQGYLVCGMATPGNAKVFTYPASLSQAIGNPRQNWIIGESLASKSSLEEFLAEIREKTRRQADVTLRLLDQIATQFLMVVFDGTDRLQHFFWKYWDPTHSRHEPQAPDKLRSAIPEYYKDLDKHLARLVERFRESNILVVSDHGFTALSQAFYIEQWLLEEDYLCVRSPLVATSNRVLGAAVRGVWQSAARLQTIRNRIKGNAELRGFVQKTREALYERGTHPGDYIDWSKTRVFVNGLSLRINLAGRERRGIVSRGEEYDRLVRELKIRLPLISDPQNHRPVIRNVYHRDEVYHGPNLQDAPDVVVVIEPGYRIQEGCPGRLVGPLNEHGRELSGDHRSEGIFIASGPDIKRSAAQIEVGIMDIMPTVLYLNHVPIPEYVDGKAITSVLREPFQEKYPIEYAEARGLSVPRSDDYSDEERAMIEEQLKALGYL